MSIKTQFEMQLAKLAKLQNSETLNEFETQHSIADPDLAKRITDLSYLIATMNIKDSKIKSQVITKIDALTNYLQKYEPIALAETEFVELKQFSKVDFFKIENLIAKQKTEDLVVFSEYLKLNMQDVSYFLNIKDPVSLGDKMKKDFNLNSSFIEEMLALGGEAKGGKGVGRGEIFLGLMIKGATNSTVGDVNVGGREFEVKSREGRLKGTKGFGSGSGAFDFFKNRLNKKFPTYFNELKDEFNGELKNWNLKTGNTNFYKLFQLAAKDGNLNKIFTLLTSTMFISPSGIWSSGEKTLEKEIINNFKKNVSKDGSYNESLHTNLNYEFLRLNINYYQSKEKYEGIFLLNDKNGRFAYLSAPVADTKWLKKHTKYTQPSWQDSQTSNCWKITLQ